MKIMLKGLRRFELLIEGTPEECADLLLVLDDQTRPHDRPESKSRSRRDRVIGAMSRLRHGGVHAASLEQIIDEVMAGDPDTERRHLDQVVRDLANKTDLVSRTDWGTFSLADQLPNPS